ncbi:hypothetical protein CEXT_389651 [Caerostris extrusa]|uniref:Uncharacterized protein n=1 Tax=Caerostris extrusa TaxID=172846 RepID=A0AAV4U686_CAEEX|nr:hypothetical protein CEXT_389651 [Caerostris extrusa]
MAEDKAPFGAMYDISTKEEEKTTKPEKESNTGTRKCFTDLLQLIEGIFPFPTSAIAAKREMSPQIKVSNSTHLVPDTERKPPS